MRRHSVYRFSFAVAVVCLVSASPMSAQIAIGQRLRVVQGVHTLTEGVYLGCDSLGYAILLSGTDTSRVPMDGSYKAERFEGSAPGGWGAFGKGIGIGAAAALVLASTAALPTSQHDNGPGNALTAFAAVALTAIGAVVGAISAASDHDVWRTVAFTPAVAASASAERTRAERAAVDPTASHGASTSLLVLP